MDTEKPPLLSIITVVFNDADNLKKTIQSIVTQSFGNYEYIIVDGGSDRETIDLIHQNKQYVSTWISEKDEGIYDAMNKGVALAKGRYINFLNAGDTYYESDTLQVVANHTGVETYDIIYGKSLRFGSRYSITQGKKIEQSNIYLDMPCCHQTLFCRRELFSVPFNTDFKYAADYDWLLYYLSDEKLSLNRTLFIDCVLVKYLDDGVSFRKIKDATNEKQAIAASYAPATMLPKLQKTYRKARIKSQVLVVFYNLNLLNHYRTLKSTFMRVFEVKA